MEDFKMFKANKQTVRSEFVNRKDSNTFNDTRAN